MKRSPLSSAPSLRNSVLLALLSAGLPVGCADEPKAQPAEGGPGADSAAPSVEFYADVAPVLLDHCVRCHQPDGQGPGDFTDPALVSAMAEIMLAQVDAGVMPPPVADPACRDYIGSEFLSIPEAKRDLISAWIDAGKPVGEPPGLPPAAPVAAELADPDLSLLIPAPYTPSFADAANPGNEYRCFALDHGQTEDFFITALHPLVDQAELLHHAVLFTIPTDELTPELTGPLGVDCINNMDATDGMVAAWAPGALPIEFEDAGMRVRADQTLILQLHYFQGADQVLADRSGYAMRIAPAVSREIIMAPFAKYNFRIPAGEADYSATERINWTSSYPAIKVWGSFPHMHRLGTGYRLWIDHPDGSSECLLSGEDRYDFHNQLTYMFRDPAVVQPGDVVSFECTWDNSAENPNQTFDPPQDIRFGERTDEEMCFAFTLVSLGGL